MLSLKRPMLARSRIVQQPSRVRRRLPDERPNANGRLPANRSTATRCDQAWTDAELTRQTYERQSSSHTPPNTRHEGTSPQRPPSPHTQFACDDKRKRPPSRASHKEGSVESNTDEPIHRNKKETNTTCGKHRHHHTPTQSSVVTSSRRPLPQQARGRLQSTSACAHHHLHPVGKHTTPSFPTPTLPSHYSPRATHIHSEATTAVVTRLWARRWPGTCRCHRR
ncbi:unnamed protein product [Ectocarpus sp. 6 AP-2014]